jgi:hypothetical protein
MGDSSITKVESHHSPRGEMGQRYLASGKAVSMRLWQESAEGDSPVVLRGAAHRYRIVDEFVAVEAASPPALARGRDEPPG